MEIRRVDILLNIFEHDKSNDKLIYKMDYPDYEVDIKNKVPFYSSGDSK